MPGGGSYTLIDVGGGTGGGMTADKAPGAPPHWLAYVGVDDVRAATQKARELGAKVVMDVMDVAQYGTRKITRSPRRPGVRRHLNRGGDTP
jgi:predicted enzyme related to lactoylglutathione lyase